MKQEKITTSKGEFIVLDVDYNSMTFVRILDTATACLGSEELFDYKKSFKLSKISEEEAREIVKMTWISDNLNLCKFKNYNTNGNGSFSNPIESLHSLLKSKGIHLFDNPYEGYNDILLSDEDNKKINDFKKGLLEQKTFYNPYIFKL